MVDSLDMEEVRKARADYYSQTPEQRRARGSVKETGAGPRKAKEKSRTTKSKERGRKTESVSERDAKGRAQARKRRKQSQQKERDDSSSEAEYVYAKRPIKEKASTRPKGKSSHMPRTEESDSEAGYVYKTDVRRSSAPSISRTPTVRTSTSRPRTVASTQRRTSTQTSNPFLRALGLQPPERTPSRRASSQSTSTANRIATTKRASSSTRASLPQRTPSSRKSSAATSTPSLPRRSASLKQTSTKPAPRPGLTRSHTTTHQTRRSSKPLETIAEKQEDRNAKMKRPTSMFGAIFGSSKPAPPEAKYVYILSCLNSLSSSRRCLFFHSLRLRSSLHDRAFYHLHHDLSIHLIL